LDDYIQLKFVKEITNIAANSSEVDLPQKVSFVPYAYQIKMSRAAVRGHPILKDFHEFLINETELVYFFYLFVFSLAILCFFAVPKINLII
jgi:hypothetical protein